MRDFVASCADFGPQSDTGVAWVDELKEAYGWLERRTGTHYLQISTISHASKCRPLKSSFD